MSLLDRIFGRSSKEDIQGEKEKEEAYRKDQADLPVRVLRVEKIVDVYSKVVEAR